MFIGQMIGKGRRNQKLIKARVALGLTQRELAIKAGMHFPDIVDLEHGRLPKSAVERKILHLAITLGVATDVVMPENQKQERLPIESICRSNYVNTAEQRILADELLDLLPDRERMILVLRFWCDFTLKEIGVLLGLSHERVRQLEVQSINTLRKRS